MVSAQKNGVRTASLNFEPRWRLPNCPLRAMQTKRNRVLRAEFAALNWDALQQAFCSSIRLATSCRQNGRNRNKSPRISNVLLSSDWLVAAGAFIGTNRQVLLQNSCEESRLLNLNPVMRMVRAYLCRFVPSISASCNSGYNRLHGTQFAKGFAGRLCLSVVHLVLDGSCRSGCSGG